MDNIAVILYSLVVIAIFALGYITCITFIPKAHKLKEIEFSLRPLRIRFIFK